MRQAGYSKNTAKNPKNLTKSRGFKAICDQNGLTPDLIVQSLVFDIRSKPGNRKQELELASKILGIYQSNNLAEPIQILRPVSIFPLNN